jgi:hypothetical protein
MNGIEMMLQAAMKGLGIDPKQLMQQVESTADGVFKLLQSIDKRLGDIETAQTALAEQMSRLEQRGFPVYPCEQALADLFNEADNPHDEFLRLQGLEQDENGQIKKPN